jgi:hypothetical protein
MDTSVLALVWRFGVRAGPSTSVVALPNRYQGGRIAGLRGIASVPRHAGEMPTTIEVWGVMT